LKIQLLAGDGIANERLLEITGQRSFQGGMVPEHADYLAQDYPEFELGP